MIKKYRVRNSIIAAVDVLRETDKSVFLPNLFCRGGEKREAKISDWCSYHDTWEEAKDFLLSKAEERVIRVRRSLANAEEDLKRVRDLHEV